MHYIGTLGDAFTLSSFTFRFLFGLALNVVFLVRGFGVAAWTHALYDVMIVTPRRPRRGRLWRRRCWRKLVNRYEFLVLQTQNQQLVTRNPQPVASGS